MYKYSSIGRSLDPAIPTNKAVLILMPIGAVLGAVAAWGAGETGLGLLRQAVYFLLIVFASWALARELAPDDPWAAFVSMAVAVVTALAVEAPGILIVIATLGLVRIVNRTTGLVAKKTDSLVVMLLVFAVMYATHSPFFGVVAALAFILDGSLWQPFRQQWIFALVCLGGTVVYVVDHDIGATYLSPPDSLFGWLAILFLLLFALDILLLRRVRSRADTGNQRLNRNRVRAGMTVGLLAALQGINGLDNVAIIIAVIAGIGVGIAFRKGFKTPRARKPTP